VSAPVGVLPEHDGLECAALFGGIRIYVSPMFPYEWPDPETGEMKTIAGATFENCNVMVVSQEVFDQLVLRIPPKDPDHA
jgi:hypothetical protein